jgi:hypothetical protein
VAAAQARESGQPAVALSLADPHWRMAAVLRPASFKNEPQPALARADDTRTNLQSPDR